MGYRSNDSRSYNHRTDFSLSLCIVLISMSMNIELSITVVHCMRPLRTGHIDIEDYHAVVVIPGSSGDYGAALLSVWIAYEKVGL